MTGIAGNRGKGLHHVSRGNRLLRHIVVEIIRPWVECHHLRAVERSFAQAMVEHGLLLTHVRANQEHRVLLFQLLDFHPQVRANRGCRLVGEIALAQAVVDVADIQTAHQTLEQVEFFQRGSRVCQRTDASRVGGAQDFGGSFQSLLPAHFIPVTIALEHRLGNAVRAGNALVAETVTVGNPAFVDAFIVTWHGTHHFLTEGMHLNVGADTIVWRNAVVGFQFPRPCLVTRWLGSQRTDWT